MHSLSPTLLTCIGFIEQMHMQVNFQRTLQGKSDCIPVCKEGSHMSITASIPVKHLEPRTTQQERDVRLCCRAYATSRATEAALHFLCTLHQEEVASCSRAVTSVILATSTCSPTHLDVLPGSDPAEACPVKLASICEHHCLSRHVEACRKCLRCKQCLQGMPLHPLDYLYSSKSSRMKHRA